MAAGLAFLLAQEVLVIMGSNGLRKMTEERGFSMKYTVQEIDDLRSVCENKYVWGRYKLDQTPSCRSSRSFNEQDKYKAVEELVRTHMLAGHYAKDLYDSEKVDP